MPPGNAETAASPGFTIAFRELSYFVRRVNGGTNRAAEIQLLNKVTGVFRPSRLCALMGVSGTHFSAGSCDVSLLATIDAACTAVFDNCRCREDNAHGCHCVPQLRRPCVRASDCRWLPCPAGNFCSICWLREQRWSTACACVRGTQPRTHACRLTFPMCHSCVTLSTLLNLLRAGPSVRGAQSSHDCPRSTPV